MGSTPPSLHGFLVIDKPAGLTSHACVARVRRAYGLRRVGHGGTLDPAVTGVLPIALGPATRLLPYLPGGKEYRGQIQLGLTTSSDDLQGEVLERGTVPPLGRDDLEAALAGFRGAILQRPPQVSAVHVQGERAYARARRGEAPELAPRPVTIHALELLGFDPATARLEICLRCSAGTYVRSLARDLGERLGCGGALAVLRRTAALGFDLSRAIPLARLEETPPPALIDPLEALPHLPRHRLDEAGRQAWRCGRALEAMPLPPAPGDPAGLAEPASTGPASSDPPVAVLGPDGILAGIARLGGDGRLHPRLVFDAAG